MVLKRKVSINLEQIHHQQQEDEGLENPPTPSKLTPNTYKRLRRQFSEQNFGRLNS